MKEERDCTIHVAKTKALISFAVTAKLICAFVFAQAFCWFSYAVAHIHCTCKVSTVSGLVVCKISVSLKCIFSSFYEFSVTVKAVLCGT